MMNPFLDRWMAHLEAQADELTEQGQHVQAAGSRQQICQSLERHLEEDHPLLITQLQRLAGCYRGAGDLPAAEGIYRRVLRLIQSRHGFQHLEFAQTLNVLGVLYCEMGRYRRAVSIYRRTLTLTRRQLDEDDPRLAAVHHNLASSYRALDSEDCAKAHYMETLRILDTCQPSAERAFCLCDLAELLIHRQPEIALDYFNESLEELRNVREKHQPEHAQALIRVAGSHFRQGRNTVATDLLREAEDLLATYGPPAKVELEQCRELRRQVESEAL